MCVAPAAAGLLHSFWSVAAQAAAEAVGKKLAELCKDKQISKVAFDRGGFKYHGRVQALADAAREGGLDF